MPTAATFRAWASRVPPGFIFSVKASRFLTHIRRLRDPRGPVEFLMERAGELGHRLGPILLQLPPDMPADLDRLARTLDAFPATTRVAVEPRHDSWFGDEVRALLERYGAALCLADRRRPVTPVWRTAGWTYLRFHAGLALPRSCYGEQALETWATRIRDGWGQDPDAFAYFNNDHAGCALRDAGVLGRQLSGIGVRIGRRPDVPPDVLDHPQPAA
jgi:uncharacterized protein YecE (DUF72 family)